MIQSLVVLSALMNMSACQSGRRIDAPRPEPLLKLFEQSAGAGTVLAADICRVTPGMIRFQKLDDDGQVIGEFTQKIQPTSRFNATIAAEIPQQEIEYRRLDDEGNVTMPAHHDQGEQAISLFKPDLVIAYAALPLGERRTSEAAMRVANARNLSQTKERGSAVRTVQYVGDQRIITPLGEFTAKRVEVHFTADLQMADADERTTLFIVPGAGVVAEQSVRKVTVLGAFGSTESRTVVLVGYNVIDS